MTEKQANIAIAREIIKDNQPVGRPIDTDTFHARAALLRYINVCKLTFWLKRLRGPVDEQWEVLRTWVERDRASRGPVVIIYEERKGKVSWFWVKRGANGVLTKSKPYPTQEEARAAVPVDKGEKQR